MQVVIPGKMALPQNALFWLLSHKIDENKISNKGYGYLSMAVWNLK